MWNIGFDLRPLLVLALIGLIAIIAGVIDGLIWLCRRRERRLMLSNDPATLVSITVTIPEDDAEWLRNVSTADRITTGRLMSRLIRACQIGAFVATVGFVLGGFALFIWTAKVIVGHLTC